MSKEQPIIDDKSDFAKKAEFLSKQSVDGFLNDAYNKGVEDAMKIVSNYCYDTPIGRMAHVGLILHTASSEIISKLTNLKK